MATKSKASPDEKFDKQELDLFEVLAALDKKDYNYFDKLSEEQQKKFVPYMMTHWMSQIKSNAGLQGYYVRSVDYHANQHLFNETVYKHPKLQWLMLCASSPGLGKQFHQWVPHLSDRISKLKEPAKNKEVKDYFKKIYPKVDDSDINELSDAFVSQQNKKVYLSKQYPDLKYSDIEILCELVTDEDIKKYEEDRGN
jgi:hypothetical protein